MSESCREKGVNMTKQSLQTDARAALESEDAEEAMEKVSNEMVRTLLITVGASRH